MGWQDIYKKKMQESGLAAGDINFVDVDTFHKREKERWASEVATGSVQTVTAPAKQKKEKYVASPYGTFLGGFSYKGNTRRQKSEQELADEAAQQAAYIKEYQRLAGLDLDSYGKQVESAKKAAQKNRTMYNVRAFGGYDENRTTDEERTYAAMQADYNKAKDIQYDIKGQEALESLTAEQSKAVETLATERSDTAKRQTAWTALQKTGLSDDEIAQLVNYQRNIPKRQKNAERYAEMQEAAEAYAETNPGLATVASVPANLLSGIGTIDAAMRKLSDPDSPVDYKSGAFLPYAYSRGVRDTVTKNLESDYGKAASFAYGVGTSMLDSAATVGLAALGIPAGVASATLGGAAATSAMTEAKARGLSDEKAILTGVLSGVAETALEKFSLESLISMKLPTGTAKQRVMGALKNAAVQAGIEGSEEMFTDFANLIFDAAVNGSMSDVQQRIAVYMAGGMDYDEARKKVLGETVKDVALDFVAGGLAGGLMGGGNMALQTAAQGAYESRVNDARMAVRQRAGVTGSYQAAEDGKTSYNGQETSVRSVVKDGKVELTTGETVDPKDVQFSDRNTADLYEGAIRTAENAGAAQVFVDSYTGGDVSTYILGMQEAYHNGKEGVPLEDAGGFAADLSDAQRKAAWEQGRAAASVPDLKDYGFGEKGTQAWNKVQENEAVRNNRRLRAGFTAMYQAGMRGESASAVKSDAAKYIPPSVQTAAYQAGLADAAESLARETDAVQFVSSAGSESGLVDNEYSRKLAEEKSGTAALLSMLGKDLGVRVEIVPKVLGGNANGQYVAGRNLVQIAADADDAFAFVAAHEVTHRMQSLAPEEYRSYRDYAMRFRAQELGEEGTVALVERYRSMSEEAGVTLTQEEAMDEITADLTMRMIEDGGLFEDFARENRSEAKKLLDALKAFVQKVKSLFRSKEARDKAAREAYGTDVATLEECVARWQKAYTAAGKAAQNAKTAAGDGSGEGRYQIKKIDGRLMTVIDTQNDTRDFKAAEAYLKTLVNTDHPFSTILMDAQPVYVGKDLPGEYRSSEYTKSMLSKLRDVKMQAATNLDEMLLLAENGEWRENVKPKHAKDAQNGWYRYDAEFAVPILNAKKAVDHYTVYGGTLLIRNDADGKSYLYDLLDIEKKKVISAASFSAETHSEVLPPKPSTNSISTSDGNVNAKFSLKKPVEETKNLLALHNLTEKNLLDAVRLGGLPMPSIAVVKGDAGHSEYGPISFVFSKDTIDPQLFRSNKVYGYDAWTPTAPQIEYEVNEKAAGRIHDLFYRMQREKGRDFANPLYSVANTLEDELNRKGGLDKVVEPMRDDPRVMNIYLEDTGRGAVEKVMRQNVSRMDENQQEMSEFLIRELGADIVDGFRPTGNEAPIAARRRWFAEHGEALNEALRKYYEKLGLPAKDAADVVNAETNAAKTKYLLNTRKYLSGNTETVTEEVDLDATNNAIRKKVDKADYDRWLDELFKGVVKNEGIYNGKDYYTSSGNRRSFSATHYEITLENIVKAMKQGDQKGTNTVFGGQAIWGVASKDYNSIDEIKADSGRLVKMTEEEYSAIRQEYSARLAELANEIKDPSAQNDFIASDDAATAIVETLRTKRTAAAIDKELRTYPTLRIRPDTAGKVLQLFEDISNMPTGYFEAKPQRAVGFDEVLAAVIPDDTSANARAALAQAGVKTIEYKSGDEQSRTDAVNSVEGARFQLKSARELEQEVRELKKYAAYRKRGTSDREILASTADGYAQTEWERKRLSEYKDVMGRLETYERRLSENKAKLEELSFMGEKKNAKRISQLKTEITQDTNRISIVENKLGELENTSSLKTLLDREKAVIHQQEGEYLRKVEELMGGYRDLYGTMAKGEKAARDIQMPKKTSENEKISQTVRTILEAKATPDEMVPTIEEMALNGEYSYEAYSDKNAISDAEEEIKRVGWAQSLSEWTNAVQKGEVSKKNTAMGWALYNNAANSGDTDTALTILSNMVEHQRSAAQALQATRILKSLSPETQLYQAQRSVDNLQTEMNKRYGDKKAPELKIDPALAEQFMQATDQETRDAVLRNIYRDIGKQMPSRFVDKWNAWRYLAMLGNARTHVRNVVGNAGFAPVVAAKNAVATGIEKAVYRLSDGKMERSKEFVFGKDGKALLKAAAQDYAKVQDVAMGGGKYSDLANANKYIEEGRVIFQSKVPGLKQVSKGLEAARKANSKALDAEDAWFSKPHYAYAMAQYCKANGITPQMIESGKGIEKAREYAIREAQKATYRDTNSFSQAISELGRTVKPGSNGTRKAVAVAMEGILPFRKTPANILVRGVEYSPIGLMNGIKQALFDVRNGTKTAAEAIDSISAGLTGTGLLGLGLFLAAQGLVRGHGSDDDDKNAYAELTGHQAYALELPDGTSITLDWLAPECLPFFIGVNLWEITDGGEEILTMSDALNAVTMVSEPLLEMSCLQSLNDVFDAVGYAKNNGISALPAALANAATSYITQALPTILGQAERAGESIRYATYTDKNSVLTSDMQYAIGRASAKIPGLDYSQIPYIDAWGRRESTGNLGKRLLNNFLNPAYVSDVSESEMEKELLRLYEATGESGVLPRRAGKSFSANKETINLTGEQYVKYAEKRGGEAYKWMTALTQNNAYRSMSDEEKADCVKYIYEAANEVAKSGIVGSSYEMKTWVKDAVGGAGVVETAIAKTKYADVSKEAVNAYKAFSGSIGEDVFLKTWDALGDITGEDYDGDGRSDAYSKIDKKLEYINGLNLTAQQKRALAIANGINEKTVDKRAPW